MTELAVHQGSSLAITQDQDFWTDKQLAGLRQLGVEGAPNGDLAVFFHQCQRTQLDPFARQIHMIQRWTKDGPRWTIQTGIDGYRVIARRAADRTGDQLSYDPTLWADPDGNWRDVWLDDNPPAAAKTTVYRNGHPFPAVALWREYVQTTKAGQVTRMWAERGAGQLAKCSEALALRKAYPQDFAGIYVHEEIRDHEPPQPQRRVTAAVIRGETEPEPDPDTGEITPGPDDVQLPGAEEWPTPAEVKP